MKIGVLTDSSSYLTTAQCDKYGIRILPLPIIWGNKTYYDLKTIDYEEFYQKLKTDHTLPTTSQPSTGEIKKAIDWYIENGYSDVIVITLSSGISNFYQTVSAYAKQENKINIHPFDSKVTCAGQASLAILAGRLVQNGADLETIFNDLKDLRSTIGVRFMVDDLKHLTRTGRLSNASSFIGGLLKIKPILSMDVQGEGKISAIGKERQTKRAYVKIKNDFAKAIENKDYPIQVTVFDALDPVAKAKWVADYKKSFPKVKVLESIIGPVVGVHVGQHCMAIIWSRDVDSYFEK